MTHVVLPPPDGDWRLGGYFGSCGMSSPEQYALSDFDPVIDVGDVYHVEVTGILDPPFGDGTTYCWISRFFSFDQTLTASVDISGILFDGEPPMGVAIVPRIWIRYDTGLGYTDPSSSELEQTWDVTIDVDGQNCVHLASGPNFMESGPAIQWAKGLLVEGYENISATNAGFTLAGDPFILASNPLNNFVFWGPDNGGTLPELVEIEATFSNYAHHVQVLEGTAERDDCPEPTRPEWPAENGFAQGTHYNHLTEQSGYWRVDVYPVCFSEATGGYMMVV